MINTRFDTQYKEDIQQGERNNRCSTARRKDLDLDAKNSYRDTAVELIECSKKVKLILKRFIQRADRD
jgi:hypothetical protein